jgi:hypothetical protein
VEGKLNFGLNWPSITHDLRETGTNSGLSNERKREIMTEHFIDFLHAFAFTEIALTSLKEDRHAIKENSSSQ